MGTKNINLPADLEAYVEAKVASGEYAHFSEVVRDGLRLLRQREAEKLEWLRNAIAEGVWSAENEPLAVLDDAEMERILARAETRAEARAKERRE